MSGCKGLCLGMHAAVLRRHVALVGRHAAATGIPVSVYMLRRRTVVEVGMLPVVLGILLAG